MLVHYCTCCFWLVKTVSNPPEELESFAENWGLDPYFKHDLVDKYILSCYFINTVCPCDVFDDFIFDGHVSVTDSTLSAVSFILYSTSSLF